MYLFASPLLKSALEKRVSFGYYEPWPLIPARLAPPCFLPHGDVCCWMFPVTVFIQIQVHSIRSTSPMHATNKNRKLFYLFKCPEYVIRAFRFLIPYLCKRHSIMLTKFYLVSTFQIQLKVNTSTRNARMINTISLYSILVI